MTHIRKGLLAGLLAGLLLAMLNFVTDGTPGRTLPDALHWYGITITDPTTSRFAGLFLLIVLGGIAGNIFGLVQGERLISVLLWISSQSLNVSCCTGWVNHCSTKSCRA